MKTLRCFNLVAIIGIVVDTASVFSVSEKTDIAGGQNEEKSEHGDLGVEKDDMEKERDHFGSDKSNENITSIEEIQDGVTKNVTEVGEEAKSKETEGDKEAGGKKDDEDAKNVQDEKVGEGDVNDDGKKESPAEDEGDYSSDENKITTTPTTTITTTRDPDADYDKYRDRSSEKWYLKFRDDHNLLEPYQLPSNKRIVELEDIRFCKCPRVYWPTCGTDNITYMNVCILKCLQKTLRRYGPCIVYRRKIKKRRQYHSLNSFTPSI